MLYSTENNAMKNSPSNTSFEIQLNNKKSNFKLVVDSSVFYSGNRLKATKKNSLVPKKFQSNF